MRIIFLAKETWSLFRPELGGQRVSSNELDRVLLDETDEARRREAWQATRAIGGRVQDWVRSLVDLRNQQAQELGFSDYYALALDDEAMSPETTDVLLEDNFCHDNHSSGIVVHGNENFHHGGVLRGNILQNNFGSRNACLSLTKIL